MVCLHVDGGRRRLGPGGIYICRLTATSGLGGMFLRAFFGLRSFLIPLPATVPCYVVVIIKFILLVYCLQLPLDVAGGAGLFMLDLLF